MQIVFFVIATDPNGNQYSAPQPDEAAADSYAAYLESQGYTNVEVVAQQEPDADAAVPDEGCSS
jgi:hypothetical protein